MTGSNSIFTLAVHAGERAPRPDFTPVSTPIYSSVGYLYDDMEELDAIFGGARTGYVYTRYGNPTVSAFERAVAILEGGYLDCKTQAVATEAVATEAVATEAVAFASGMAAVCAALLGSGARPGERVVSAADVYGATYAVQEKLFASLGISTRFVDIADLDQVQRAVREGNPVALLCEVMSNPLLVVADVPSLAEIAHAAGTALIVDSTFASPYLVRPLELGADYVVHSATKYLSGHGDVMAGVVACSADRAHDLRERQKLLGANLGPQEAWLALRGLKTLAVRVRQQCASAQRVAEALGKHQAVGVVHYPGLPEHPQHDLARRLFEGRGFGGMLGLELRDAGQAEVFRFMEALKLVLPATTLGDVYSLCLYPAHSSHRQVSPEVRAALGIGDGLVRLSVGIEDANDIITDLTSALDAASSTDN